MTVLGGPSDRGRTGSVDAEGGGGALLACGVADLCSGAEMKESRLADTLLVRVPAKPDLNPAWRLIGRQACPSVNILPLVGLTPSGGHAIWRAGAVC